MIRPLGINILLKKLSSLEKTKSGIILSSEDKDAEKMGEVISIGKDVKNIKAKDKVIFESYKGTDFTYQDEKFILIEEKNCLAIID